VVDSRLEKAKKVTRKLKRVLKAIQEGRDPRPHLEDIHELGNQRWIHAGMVRAMFVQSTGWSWAQLEAFLAT